jgi:DnaJ domain
METLYDLLGALPRDDAEALRTAFRQAVKSTHPDINPGDPEAGRKFRQIVRAQEILLDSEQRAAYDHLLELARVEAAENAQHAAQHARAGRIHRLASWVMALAGASAISIAGLAVVALLWTSTQPAADAEIVAEDPAPTKVAGLPELPSPAAPPAETADSTLPPLGPPLDISPPVPTEVDRLHSFDHAFADISHARRPDKPGHAANAKKKGPVATESDPKPTPTRQTAAYDPSRQESPAFQPRP